MKTKKLSLHGKNGGVVGGVGLRWWFALVVAIAGASEAQCQTVTLGAANFKATSDQFPPDWYWPMPGGVTHIYDGYGAFAGATRTETYMGGQLIAGVKAVKWRMETKNAGASTATAEEWWLARDADGNVRVLKIAQSGSEVYVVSGASTPPIYLPSNPTKGKAWDFLGNKMTIEGVMASRNARAGLKLGIAAPGSPVEYNTYNAGVGLVQEAVSANPAPIGSGWTRRVR
jgi:hypothetical protein